MILPGCFLLIWRGPKRMKKHSAMIQILLTEKIDCIHFAKLSLYSVNTVQVCKICRLRLYCKKKTE